LPIAPGKTYSVRIVDPQSGSVVETRGPIRGPQVSDLKAPTVSPYVLWLEEM
jgi:hypothetical protein